MIMTAKDFFKQFPDESACVHHMKKMREKNGLVCRKCASKRLSWLSTINRWECMDCRAKTTIRSGTIMMHSKLPLHTWYYCMFLMMTTTKAVSAKDMQQRLGMKRYEPVWYMMQKIRLAMGKANESVKLDGTVEFDDGFFRAEKKEKDLYQQLFNRGRGSERTQPVLVAVQRVTRSKSKKRNDMEENTRAGRLRMEHLPDFSGMTYGVLAKRLLTKQADQIYEPTYGHKIELQIKDDENNTTGFSYITSEQNSTYQVNGLENGIFTYEARAVINGNNEIATGSFTIRDLQIETTNLTANHDLLRNVSAQNGGEFYTKNQLDQLRDNLMLEEQEFKIYSSESYLAIINMKWGFFVLIIFVSVEWFLRKYNGSY
jgi:hypothetical protein